MVSSRWGIADSLEFHGSDCSVLVFCIPMFKTIYICHANDKSASVPVCYGRRVTSSTEITCLEDAIRSQRTHTECRSPIGANDIGRNPASGCAKRFSANQRLARPSTRDVPTSSLKNHIKGPAHWVKQFSLGLTLEVLSSRLMHRFGTLTSH